MKNNKKKVCFIISTFDSGGTENYLLRFLNFSKDSIEATVICKNNNCTAGVLKKEYDKLGIPIICQSLGYINLKKFKRFFFILKQNNFDTICDLTGNFGGIPMLFANILKIDNRIVFYRRSSYAFKQTKFNLIYNYFVNKLVDGNATKVFSNSSYAINFFFPYKNDSDKRFKVIYNGVNFNDYFIKESKEEIRKILGIKKDVYLVGHIGRYDSAKNHQTIFKVIKEMVKKDSNIEFLFCGKDTNSESFKEEIAQYGIINNVHLLGERSDIPRILKSLDLFYFPSVTEGQPNALIEAMLSDLAIITSNIAPIKEIIPKLMYQQLLDPLEIEKTVDDIKHIKNNPNIQDKYNLKDWAINKFNSEANFKIFEKEL